MRNMAKFLAVAVLAASLAGMGTSPVGASAGGTPTYYLALGDSVAADDPFDVPHYPRRLHRRVRDEFDHLRLRNLACPGESTDTLIGGGICEYSRGSQLAEAVAFLRDHQGHVGFITINIGTNDVLGTDAICMGWDGRIHPACLKRELPGLRSNLARIVRTLQAEAPGVPILGMNYYNPFLGFWVLLDDGHRVARWDQANWELLNEALVTTYRGEGATVVDVAGPDSFDTANFTDRVYTEEWGVIPVNVAKACSWTYFCARGDIHPNSVGHTVIAAAFEKALDL